MAHDRTGSRNSNWRGGTMGKGTCLTCGAPTYRQGTRCRNCYYDELRQRTGAANPEWNKFSSTDPQQGRDRAKRRKVLGPCERCGKPGTDRHHKDDNPMNNAPDNIEVLCRRCHMITDGRMGALVKRMTERRK